jgi:hypothetical protein
LSSATATATATAAAAKQTVKKLAYAIRQRPRVKVHHGAEARVGNGRSVAQGERSRGRR